jgi:hypothetical protein
MSKNELKISEISYKEVDSQTKPCNKKPEFITD